MVNPTNVQHLKYARNLAKMPDTPRIKEKNLGFNEVANPKKPRDSLHKHGKKSEQKKCETFMNFGILD